MKFKGSQIVHQPKSEYLGKNTKPIKGQSIIYMDSPIYGEFKRDDNDIILTLDIL